MFDELISAIEDYIESKEQLSQTDSEHWSIHNEKMDEKTYELKNKLDAYVNHLIDERLSRGL